MENFGLRILDFGLRPLRAVGSIYEPEAGGAIGASAPEGFVVSLAQRRRLRRVSLYHFLLN